MWGLASGASAAVAFFWATCLEGVTEQHPSLTSQLSESKFLGRTLVTAIGASLLSRIIDEKLPARTQVLFVPALLLLGLALLDDAGTGMSSNEGYLGIGLLFSGVGLFARLIFGNLHRTVQAASVGCFICWYYMYTRSSGHSTGHLPAPRRSDLVDAIGLGLLTLGCGSFAATAPVSS